MGSLAQFPAAMICLKLSLACTAVEAPTDPTSLAVPAMDPETVIIFLNQPHIVLDEIALWGGTMASHYPY